MPSGTFTNDLLRQQFFKELEGLWPPLKGSVAQVRRTYAHGDEHPAFIFGFTERGRRRCMYVSAEMVPLLRQGLANGRRLEQLLYGMGPALLRQHRHGEQ